MTRFDSKTIERFYNAQLDDDPDSIKAILEDLEENPEDGEVARFIREQQQKTLATLASQGFEVGSEAHHDQLLRSSGRHLATQPQAERRSWFGHRPVLISGAVAAACATVLFVIWLALSQFDSVERMIVAMHPEPRQTLDAADPIVELDRHGDYRIDIGRRFDLTLRSPIEGYVSFVFIESGVPRAFSANDNGSHSIAAFEATSYGPFPPITRPLVILAVVTPTDIHSSVRSIVDNASRPVEAAAFANEITAALSEENSPIGIGVIHMKPTGRRQVP